MIATKNSNILPKKWNLFKIVTIIHLVLNIILLIFFLSVTILFLLTKINLIDDFSIVSFMILIPICVTLFQSISLNLILKKYPNGEISKNLNFAFGILFIVACFCLTAITCLFLFGLWETYKSFILDTPNYNGLVVLIFLFIYVVSLGYIIRYALKLRNLIKRNFIYHEIEQIDLIGKKQFVNEP